MDDLTREHLISDVMRSEELQNAFMQRHAEALDEGLFKRGGRDALDGAAEAEERLRTVREELLGQAGNERQRAMLGEDLDAHLTVARDDIARHVARQTLQWERSVRQQRLDLLHAKARRDFADPARLAVYADAAATAGENADAARSALYRIAIGEALARGQHKAALDLVDRSQQHLSPADRADLEAELGIAGQLQRGNDYLGMLLPNVLPATATDTDAAHEAAWRKNLIDWAHDPDQQATNRHLIDVRFGQHHRGLQKAQLALNDAVQAWMGETDADGDPQTRRPPPALWKQLDADQRREIDTTLARNARGDAPAVEPPPGEEIETAPAPDKNVETVHRDDGGTDVTVHDVPTPVGPAEVSVSQDADGRSATSHMTLPDGHRVESRRTGSEGGAWSQIDTVHDPAGAVMGEQTTSFDGKRLTRTWEPVDGPGQSESWEVGPDGKPVGAPVETPGDAAGIQRVGAPALVALGPAGLAALAAALAAHAAYEAIQKTQRPQPLEARPPAKPEDVAKDDEATTPPGIGHNSGESSGQEEPPQDDEVADRPPTGSKPINQTPWSGDHGVIKTEIDAAPHDNVSISPDGSVWAQQPDGRWRYFGPAADYTGSGQPKGQRGKDRKR